MSEERICTKTLNVPRRFAEDVLTGKRDSAVEIMKEVREEIRRERVKIAQTRQDLPEIGKRKQ